MSGLNLTITNAGRAALVNAANNGTAPVLMAAVGVSPTAVAPAPDAIALPNEIKRISTISGDAVANDTIHVTIRDESVDTYTVRSFALYLNDGTLFALYGQVAPIMEKSAQAMLLLALDVIFADINAEQIVFGDTSFLNPPATTERQGVVELATSEETTNGVDTIRAVTPKGLKAAVTGWLDSRLGTGAPSTFVKSLLTSASVTAFRSLLDIKSAALKNEGSGNGLDADLLDGKHGSDYAAASHTHAIGNVAGLQAALDAKLAAVSYTAGDVLAKITTVDGSGSGLDADMLDGYNAGHFMGAQSISANAYYGATAIRNGWYGIIFGEANTAPALIFDPTGKGGLFSESNGWRWYWDGLDIQIGAVSGRKVWHAGNDGSGSGLDADTLDGSHAAAFAPVIHYHQNLSGSNYTNGTEKPNSPVFGAGGFRYQMLSSPNIGGPTYWNDVLWVSSYSGPDVKGSNAIVMGKTGDFIGFCRQDYDAASWGQLNTIWHTGNDGSGSGMDADTLDGRHASEFPSWRGNWDFNNLVVHDNILIRGSYAVRQDDFSASKATNGYCRLPNGMIIQAGRYSQNANTLIPIAFPLAFPNLCMGVVTGGTGDMSYGAEGNTSTVQSGSVTTGGFYSHNANDNNTTAYWIAFGY